MLREKGKEMGLAPEFSVKMEAGEAREIEAKSKWSVFQWPFIMSKEKPIDEYDTTTFQENEQKPTYKKLFILVFFMIGFLTGCFLYNWSTLKNFVEKECPSSKVGDGMFSLRNLNKILPMAVSAMCLFTMIGGVILDVLGPISSFSFGLILEIVGWSYLSFIQSSSKKCVQEQLIAVFFICLGHDPIYLSLIKSSSLLFTGEIGLIFAYIAAGQSLSYGVPIVINKLRDDNLMKMKYIGLIYVLSLLAFSVCVYIPLHKCEVLLRTKDKRLREQSEKRKLKIRTNLLMSRNHAHSCAVNMNNKATQDEEYYTVVKRGPADLSLASMSTANYRSFNSCMELSSMNVAGRGPSDNIVNDRGNKYKLQEAFRPSRILSSTAYSKSNYYNIATLGNSVPREGIGSIGVLGDKEGQPKMLQCIDGSYLDSEKFSASRENLSMNIDAALAYVDQMIAESKNNSKREKVEKEEKEFDELRKAYLKLFIYLVPYTVITILYGVFFTITSSQQVLPIFQFLLPCSFLPAIMLGYLVDRYGIIFAMFLANVCGFVLFASIMMSKLSNLFQYTAVFCGIMALSFLLTQFHFFVILTFPLKYFGRVSGLLIMASGIFSLVATPMCDLSSYEKSYVIMNGLCLGLISINFILLYAVGRYKKQLQDLVKKNQPLVEPDTIPKGSSLVFCDCGTADK